MPEIYVRNLILCYIAKLNKFHLKKGHSTKYYILWSKHGPYNEY